MDMDMDGSVRSGGVLKKKSSSGCLIIKKKVENGSYGVGGSNINGNEKKRPRLVPSDSDVSDEDEALEFVRRKVNDKRLYEGPMGYDRSDLGYRKLVGMNVDGERKRSRSNLYGFDDYNEFDGQRMRGEYAENRLRIAGHSGGENSKDFGVGSSHRNLNVDKRKKNSYFDGPNGGRRSNVGDHVGFRNKGSEMEEDEARMPVSLARAKYQQTSDEPIRLQGKNGVLKVMVNKKKNMDLHPHYRKFDHRKVEESGLHPHNRKYSPREHEELPGPRSRDVLKKELSPALAVYVKPPEHRSLSVEKEKMRVKLEKVKPVLGKSVNGRESEVGTMVRGSKDREMEREVTDTTLKLAPLAPKSCSSKKGMEKEEERTPPENAHPITGKERKGKETKEVKAKRGGSTEKQILREKIRGMLLDNGWTIDYRPRRNRDYLDAVYINPSGTAYWSIIKAHEALKKQLGEDVAKAKLDVDSPSFAPLSEDLINKLTRQTKKKIEAEMKRKRKEDGKAQRAKKSEVGNSEESLDSDQNEERFGSYVKQNNKKRKGKLLEVDKEREGVESSEDSPKRKPKKVKDGKSYSGSNSNVLQGRTSKVIGRCTLLVRGSDRGDNSESDGYIPYSGKRTVLAWLIDSGTAHLSEKVQYMNRKRTRVMLEGWITRDGIHCGCCSKILTVSKFELHAGSKLRQPFQNIFVESGASLMQCQIDAWNKQGESMRRDYCTVDVDGDEPDDDTCGLCGDGGALICCDSCPSTFHLICLGIQVLPLGDWHCPNCVCKFCGDASGISAEGNDGVADDLTRCSFCGKKYHKSCSVEVHDLPMSSSDGSFCGLKCHELYDHLQKILGVKHELEDGFSWSFIQQADVSDNSHRGFSQMVECNSKLAVALSVMDECFLPIIDRRSGINILHNVVYSCGANFNRLNYSGFYTAILERGDEIVCAASIRIHGSCLAEMPFIGTREIYRRQGMCRRLLSAIETELRSLKVEKLIIPAISEHRNTWTTVFGFHPIDDGLKKEIKSINMLVFPETDMLQKQLVNQEISYGTKLSETIQKQAWSSPAFVEKPEINSSMERKPLSSVFVGKSDIDSSVEQNNHTTKDPYDSSAGSASDSPCESDIDLASKRKFAVENEQKECSTSAEIRNVSGIKNGFPHKIQTGPEDNENQKPLTSDSAEFVDAHAVEQIIEINESSCFPSLPDGEVCVTNCNAEVEREAVAQLQNDLITHGDVPDEAGETEKSDFEIVVDGKTASTFS
ncbi:acyl-CoA N-acyltransferase [Striga asiatica]|uniref:Acyl-CoA N-acyltransferase n=1 Tax=Striga asiatica TaxID=4170 RepID=A0A5A7Q2U8_STRAF|nr:acyl-CoA N-acyltransferase [Striga asiatica]